jgi:Na+/phosphate symporter
MVAMGTSLSDRAWGRESAVYRITGVVTVISGWFFTAFSAFTLSFCVALFLNWGGLVAIIIALSIAVFFVIRTNFIHKKIYAKQNRKDDFDDKLTLSGENVLHKCSSSITGVTEEVSRLLFSSILNLIKEDRKHMKKVLKQVADLNRNTKELKNNIYPTLKKLEEGFVETGHFYVQVLDYLREVAHCLEFIAEPIYDHLNNNHPSLPHEQVKDLHDLNESLSSFFNDIQAIFRKQNFVQIEKLIAQQKLIIDLIAKSKKKQIKLIKEDLVGTRNIMMYLNLLSESKNLVLYSVNMVKSYRDFMLSEEIRKK